MWLADRAFSWDLYSVRVTVIANDNGWKTACSGCARRVRSVSVTVSWGVRARLAIDQSGTGGHACTDHPL